MIVESDLVLDRKLLRHVGPSDFGRKVRSHSFWRVIDSNSIESEDGVFCFDELYELLDKFLETDAIVSDINSILYKMMQEAFAVDGIITERAIKCKDITVIMSSKDRTFYSLRYGNIWGSVWIWDDILTPAGLRENVKGIIDGFCDAGWSISRVSPPAKMFEELLLDKSSYRDFPDIVSGAIDEKVAIRAWNCFRGGRMEAARLGSCKNVFDYDLNTAYFSVLRNLPSLRFVEWVDTNKYVKEAFFGYCRCEVDVADSAPIGLCAVRLKSGKKPMRQYFTVDLSTCWRTKSEIDLLNNSGWAKVNILEGSWGIPKGSAPLAFAYVSRILERALADKRCYNMAKVMCSVCWGKMASVSSSLFNPVYASYITSEVRSRVTELALGLEKSLIAIAVDGISLFKELPRHMISSEIGALKEKKIDNLISLTDYYRYNFAEPSKSWRVESDGIALNALPVKIPFGSSKRVSPKDLSFEMLRNEQFLLRPPTSQDAVELYFSTKDMVPWDVV
jgi:hypothetical protein